MSVATQQVPQEPTQKRVGLWIEQGATFKRRLRLKLPDGTTPYDLTGYKARMMIRARYDDTDPILSLTSNPAAGITIDGVNGIIDLVITDEQTAELPANSGAVYDLEIESAAGEVTRLMYGDIQIDQEVTR